MQLIARPRSKLRPEGRSCVQHRSRTLASSTHSQARSNRPRTLSTGGMSYGKLPSGACGLIRSLRVSTLKNRHDTESPCRLCAGITLSAWIVGGVQIRQFGTYSVRVIR